MRRFALIFFYSAIFSAYATFLVEGLSGPALGRPPKMIEGRLIINLPNAREGALKISPPLSASPGARLSPQ
ncbi:MAG: hypothetical protein CVV34_01350 [Methanomicrobiales archaeon HGW-Methanomicrobiales-5]|nr:MAG: hypothetical protein CVV34_01350 [Methanomicrobiales archaeon HGW-Methanomicrobiales-5]